MQLLTLEASRERFHQSLTSEKATIESHYTIQSRDGKAHQVVTVSNKRHDESGRIMYTRNFSRDETHAYFQQTLQNLSLLAETSQQSLESKDRFTRQLFHETKTPCQILMALKYTAKFKNDEDYHAFCIAIDSLSNLTLDMSILTGNVNNDECLATDTTLMDYTNGIISNVVEIGDILGLAYQNNEMPQFEFNFDDKFTEMRNISRLLPRAMYHLIRNSIKHNSNGHKIFLSGNILHNTNQLRFTVINACDSLDIQSIRNSYELNDSCAFWLPLSTPTTPERSARSLASSSGKSICANNNGYGLKIANIVAKALNGSLR